MKKFIFVLVFLCFDSFNAEALTIDFGNISGSTSARLIQLIVGIAVVSLAPAIVMMTTSFTRIIIVFSFLRNALGLQQSPPNVILVSLSLFLSMFIMSNPLEKAYFEGVKPLIEEKITEEEAFDKISNPIKAFMLNQMKNKDLENFASLSKIKAKTKYDLPLKVIIPAFMISEIKKAFQIGFLIFLPFLIIDMVISSLLMAMGMMMLPPVMISLPFKIIFFVLVDGWTMLSEGLVKSFHFT